jgi:hypothetical protein
MCNFSINFIGEASAFITKVEAAIDETGGSFTGDTSSGNFSVPSPFGRIKGTYSMNHASQVDITITQKPSLVVCKAIENELNHRKTSQQF